jgi:NADPH-dependent 2,4-dienoyl-CoA reductase/sulfur reductase-like enzyme
VALRAILPLLFWHEPPVPKGPAVTDRVVIVGAGAAGLATARELSRRRIRYRLLERGHAPGQTWHDLYDSLRLHTGRHLSGLPGLRMPRSTPLFPSRLDYQGYLRGYARHFDIEVETGRAVTAAHRAARCWQVTADGEQIEAASLVIATGIVANPFVPVFRHRSSFEERGGQVLHAAEYRRPEPFLGRRVLVIGVGNSGGEIGSELGRAGVEVDIAVRSGANVVPLTLAGVPIQYLATLVRKLPRPAQHRVVSAIRRLSELRRGPPVLPPTAKSPLDSIPLIGFHLDDQIRAGRVRVRPGVEAFTSTGVRFFDGSSADYDVVILATGFRPALGLLGDTVQRDINGFAARSDRVTSADHAGLYFVGHNYDARGGLLNITVDAPAAAERIAAL